MGNYVSKSKLGNTKMQERKRTKLNFSVGPLTSWPTLHQTDMNLDQKDKSVDFDVLPLGGLNERAVKDFATDRLQAKLFACIISLNL